ncbi:hypothetical protein MAP00_006090 [Monascus purpureus]|nr:hypothetical protein MAP00_006090 [Monascus purpureus]
MNIHQAHCLLPEGGTPQVPESNITPLRRFSQWLRSGWTTAGTTSTTVDNNDSIVSASAETSIRVSGQSTIGVIGNSQDGSHATDNAHKDHETFPCRTCRMRKVECDRSLPRCSNCLHEQLLCFYVEPLRVSRKRAKDLQLQSSLQEQRPAPLQESRC